jgi:hypothetical protein
MTESKAIITGALLVSASILGHLAYSALHDGQLANRETAERTAAAHAAVEQYKRAQAKSAWDAATKDMYSILEDRARKASKLENSSKQIIIFADMKTYYSNDISWKDDRHLVATGLIRIFSGRAPRVMIVSWIRNMELLDDGEWDGQSPVFAPAKVTQGQFSAFHTKLLRNPGESN